jgi:3-isopropylmalate/(R)-2-methylmalate dehydratase small subunit
MIITGRVWKFGDNINTDLIQPVHAILKPVGEQPRYVFEATRPDWAALVTKGDIIIGGRNFGTGSGRPAARVLLQLGISCLIADSIAGLFFRNCMNYGLPAIECDGVSAMFEEGDRCEAHVPDGLVRNLRSNEQKRGLPIPDQLFAIVAGGGVFPLLEKEGSIRG